MVDSEQTVVDAAPSAETSDSLGDVLRTARAAHDLTLDQVATELRIEARHLQALEENRFEPIGVPVFVKGYIRQYGQRLGLDYGDLLALYYKQTKLTEVAIQPSKTIRLRDERQITLWIVALVILAVLAAGLAYYWFDGDELFSLGSAGGEVTSVAPVAAPDDTSVPGEPESAPALGFSAVSTPPPERVSPSPVEAADARVAPVVSREAEPVAAPIVPPREPTAAASAEPAAAASAEPADSVRPIVPAAGNVAIELTFDDESWVEITDARGTRLFYSLGVAGRRATVQGEPPFAAVIGNAPAVRLVVDGAPYPIPQEGRQGNLARFSIDIAEE
jgi:cytoskeleton protein RodZ